MIIKIIILAILIIIAIILLMVYLRQKKELQQKAEEKKQAVITARENGLKVYDLEAVPNARDLGGYKTTDGKITKYGRFIRSGNFNAATHNDITQLETAGVGCIIDLRSLSESGRCPDKIPENSTIKPVSFRMLNSYTERLFSEGKNARSSLNEMYDDLLENNREVFKDLFSYMAASEDSCILFHCSGGKDRTGFTSLFLLAIAGVSDDDLLRDYGYTELFYRNYMKAPKNLLFLSQTEPCVMAEKLKWMYETFNGPVGYLKSCGVTDKEIDILRHKLTDEC